MLRGIATRHKVWIIIERAGSLIYVVLERWEQWAPDLSGVPWISFFVTLIFGISRNE